MSRGYCSPFKGQVEVVSRSQAHAATAMDVDPGEPVFAGHYPDFPIFPGVCLMEFAHRSAQSVPPEDGGVVELVGVDRARFLSPVYPGDRLEAELGWTAKNDGWQCSALISTARGKAAHIRLRYRTEGK